MIKHCYQGYATKNEAMAHVRKRGGIFCHANHSNKNRREQYANVVAYGGLNQDKYPYCVCWNETC